MGVTREAVSDRAGWRRLGFPGPPGRLGWRWRLAVLGGLLLAGYAALQWYRALEAATRLAVAGALLAAMLGTAYLLLRRRWLRRRRVRALGELLALSPAEFEEAVAELLRHLGYRGVERVGGRGDRGVDIRCRHPRGGTLIVQCKRHAPGIRVGSPDVQALIGMVAVHRADGGLLVTTSSFSAPARELAREHGVGLLDGETISRIAERAGRR